MKARPGMSMLMLEESLDQVREFHHARDLFDFLAERFDFWQPTPENIKSWFWCHDDRIDWDTWILTIDGHAALFCDSDPTLLPS
jgi:hypothetical protein